MSRPARDFWFYVEKTESCWLWRGGKTGAGYGAYALGNRRQRLAHRISYELAFGAIPKGLLVCHHCDDPPCVNPEHLFLGTHADNAMDRTRKGRGVSRFGEEHLMAKLTWDSVRAARARYRQGERVTDLSRDFRINVGQMSRILQGKAWIEYTP